MKLKVFTIFSSLLFCVFINAQDVTLFEQLNGRYDYLAIGNTLNTAENGNSAPCTILTSSSAELELQPNQTIIAAYLYWAGSGAGDFDVSLNENPITAQRTFSDALDDTRIFFAGFADVTDIVSDQGNGAYNLSDLDISSIINPYCPSGTNFAGWALTVIYEDTSLPLNQVNVYDGLQSVPDELTITLGNLNVLDNENAKIGFIAWEGDRSLAVNEQLSINGNTIGNPPLNPINNAFNGTNSFTGATDLFNMDIDVYNIQNNISIGDTSATISLTSGQDFVMINAVITVLNSQLPDATINAETVNLDCDSRTFVVNYTVSNTNSSGILPQNTPIAFYADTILIGQSQTNTNIQIGGSESGSISLTIPETIPDSFELKIVVDDDGTSNGIVIEANETNNTTEQFITLLILSEIEILENITSCNLGFEVGEFNLLDATENLADFMDGNFQFYTNLEDLRNGVNSIMNPNFFNNTSNPETIYIRLENDPCYDRFQFNLIVENCPPEIPEGFSPNNDTKNDWFNIKGLYTIFTSHELKIYNRLGTLIFEGDTNNPWQGFTNRGTHRGNLVPVGTYYYVLNLNDDDYKPLSGWVYVNY